MKSTLLCFRHANVTVGVRKVVPTRQKPLNCLELSSTEYCCQIRQCSNKPNIKNLKSNKTRVGSSNIKNNNSSKNDYQSEEKMEDLKMTKLRSKWSEKMGVSSVSDKISDMREKSSNWDNIIKRVLRLKTHDGAIVHLNGTFYGTNLLFSIPFAIGYYYCYESIFFMPELICSYLLTRGLSRIPPISNINIALCHALQARYPLLKECKWTRALPDPTCQSMESNLRKYSFNVDNLPSITKFTFDIRQMLLKNHIKYGLAYDAADNTRTIFMLPLMTAFLYLGGVGPIVANSPIYIPQYATWMCGYIVAAYGARLSFAPSLRWIALPNTEKRYGIYYKDGDVINIENIENENMNFEKIKSQINKQYEASNNNSKQYASERSKQRLKSKLKPSSDAKPIYDADMANVTSVDSDDKNDNEDRQEKTFSMHGFQVGKAGANKNATGTQRVRATKPK